MEGGSPANRQNINNSNAIFYVSFGVCLLLYLSTYLIGSNDVADQAIPVTNIPPPPPVDVIPPPVVKRVAPPKPPTTPASYRITHVLPEILQDYKIDAGGCWPTDVNNEAKHRLPPPLTGANKPEPKSVMVVYVAVALLLMSLGATLVDFCKAKSELTNNANDLHASRKKPALTRRCSLADLTVLRHTRKELLRKESFCAAGERDWKINRPPLRLD